MVVGAAGVAVVRATAASSLSSSAATTATNSTARTCPGRGALRLPLRPCPTLRARTLVSAATVRVQLASIRRVRRQWRRSRDAVSARLNEKKRHEFFPRRNAAAEERSVKNSLHALPLCSRLLSLLCPFPLRVLTNSRLPPRNSGIQIQKQQNAAPTGSDDVSAPSSPASAAASSSGAASSSSSSSRAPRRDWRPNAFQKNDDELHT